MWIIDYLQKYDFIFAERLVALKIAIKKQITE